MYVNSLRDNVCTIKDTIFCWVHHTRDLLYLYIMQQSHIQRRRPITQQQTCNNAATTTHHVTVISRHTQTHSSQHMQHTHAVPVLQRKRIHFMTCDTRLANIEFLGEESHTLTLRTSQGRITKRESTGRVVIVIVITRIVERLKRERERESASQSKLKGVTKQHVTQISQRTKYHSTPHHSTQHITHKHITHTSHWVLTETDRNEKRKEWDERRTRERIEQETSETRERVMWWAEKEMQMRPERGERWKETAVKNYCLQFFKNLLKQLVVVIILIKMISCDLLFKWQMHSQALLVECHVVCLDPVARTDPCHKLKTQAGTYENGRHGRRAWFCWWCIALWRAEEQRSRMTCAAEGDDRRDAGDVSTHKDICTSDETYSMKWCICIEERLKLM